MLLPINENPPINGYQYMAYPLSIICTTNNYLPWLSEHYIQLFCNPNDVLVQFYEPSARFVVPWFGIEDISQETIKSLNLNVNEVITDYLNRGYYLYIPKINEYFVPSRNAYHQYNKTHDILIFGFNCTEKKYDVIGYDNRGIYCHTYISFEELKKAFFSINDTDLLFVVLNDNYTHNFIIKNVIQLLNDYLYSKNTSENFKLLHRKYINNHVFGLQIYDYLKSYFETCLNRKIKDDIRSLHFLKEHKYCMLLRINYLTEKGYLQDSTKMLYNSYKEIYNEVTIAKNLELKYRINKNENNIISIINKLDYISKKEKILIENLLNIIKI